MGLLACTVLGTTAMIGLRDPRLSANHLKSRALPAQIALSRTAVAAARGQESLMVALEAQDPAARIAALTAAEDTGRVKDASWNTYKALALNTPAELTLIRSYETASARAIQLGAVLLTLDPTDPSRPTTLADERAASASQLEALVALQVSIYEPLTIADAAAGSDGLAFARTTILIVLGIVGLVFGLVSLLVLIGARRDQRRFTEETAALRLAGQTADFEGSLQRGLEMAPTEELAVDVVRHALSIVAADVPAEFLLADSTHAHFRQVHTTDATADAGCGVGAPGDCPAARSGQTQIFEDSTLLDACRFLRSHDDPVWSICVPVSIAGHATGVIRAQQTVNVQPSASLAAGMELVARKSGDRIGAVRVLSRTEAEAQVDPLTGLPNRRTLEHQVAESGILDAPYVVAFADLDHFKLINDVHGHAIGDRALRLFARVLRDSIRPRDLLARYGGEEFVAVLPDCAPAAARLVAERIRSELAARLVHSNLPSFTVTIGLAAASGGEELLDVIAAADGAMLRAKAEGRDRVFVSEPSRTSIGPGLAKILTDQPSSHSLALPM